MPTIGGEKILIFLQLFGKLPEKLPKVQPTGPITKLSISSQLVAICTEAGIKALHDDLGAEKIEWRHFEYALSVVKPRTPESLLRIYDRFQECL